MSKQITVVVDEPQVRALILRLLHRELALIHEAGPCERPECPEQCDLRCCSDDSIPDLVVLEVIVPRSCSGVEAGSKALKRWPKVKLLFISASPPDMWPEQAAELLNSLPSKSYMLLPKPFTAQQFHRAVSGLLDSAPVAV